MTTTTRSDDTFLDWVLAADVESPLLRRQARLLSGITLLLVIVGLIGLFSGSTPSANVNTTTVLVRRVILVISLLVIFFVNRRGLTEIAGVMLAAYVIVIASITLSNAEPSSAIAIMLVGPILVAAFFGPWWSTIIAGVAGFIAFFFINTLAVGNYTQFLAENPAASQVFWLVTLSIAVTTALAAVYTRSMQRLFLENEYRNRRLLREQELIEGRVQEQSRQLRSSVEVARVISGERDVITLMEKIIQAVRESFGYYHVQIFIIDPEGRYAVLRESTGDVGQALLARGHRLPVGSLSVIGQVTATGRPVVARDTDRDTVHRRNELLPRTRSELAVPLSVDERIIGALDLQSVEADAFTPEDIETLQALADQIATALDNARVFSEAEENLRELQELSQQTTRENWIEFLGEARIEERQAIYGPEPDTLRSHRQNVIERVQAAGMAVVDTGSEEGQLPFLAVPIVVRDQVVGVLGIEPDRPREWTRDDLNLLTGIAERTALAVENARLYMQAQRAVERERLINEIASRLQRAPSLRLLLEAATRELASALGTDKVYAEINLDQPLSQPPRPQLEEGAEVQGDPEPDEDSKARAEL